MIDTLGWRSGVLIVRLFENNFSGTGDLNVAVINQMVSSDDPGTVFNDADNPIAIATVNGNTGAPYLFSIQFSGAISRYIGVLLVYTATGSISGSTVISVDLLGRDT